MHVYHLTDYRNIKGIRDRGLVPASELVGAGLKIWWLSAAWSAALDKEKGKRDCVFLMDSLEHPIVPAFRARCGWRRIVCVVVDLRFVAAPISWEEHEIRVYGRVGPEALVRFGKLPARAAVRRTAGAPRSGSLPTGGTL